MSLPSNCTLQRPQVNEIMELQTYIKKNEKFSSREVDLHANHMAS